MGRLTRPSVVVVGDLDRLTTVADNEAIAARLPHGTIDVVAGAGHVIIKEQPGRVAEHIVRLAGQAAPDPTVLGLGHHDLARALRFA